nr:MAG TPA: hypothetical protein [Caudoviricetes sp.]
MHPRVFFNRVAYKWAAAHIPDDSVSQPAPDMWFGG